MKHKINFILPKIHKRKCKQKYQNRGAGQFFLFRKRMLTNKSNNYKKNNNLKLEN